MGLQVSPESAYKAYLLPNEKLQQVFHLGVWKFKSRTVLATNRRMLIIKKFPRNLVDIDYSSIEIVEYYTNVEWIRLLFSLLLGILGILFSMNQALVIQSIGTFFPPIAPILTSGSFLGVSIGSFLIVGVFIVAAVYYMGFWVISLFGKFRLIMFDQAPIDVVTSFDDDTQKLINLLEQRKPALSASELRKVVSSSPSIGVSSGKEKKEQKAPGSPSPLPPPKRRPKR